VNTPPHPRPPMHPVRVQQPPEGHSSRSCAPPSTAAATVASFSASQAPLLLLLLQDGVNTLLIAAATGNADILQLLLNAGAKVHPVHKVRGAARLAAIAGLSAWSHVSTRIACSPCAGRCCCTLCRLWHAVRLSRH
jgi:hypothetical protein